MPELFETPSTMKCFCCDLNWTRFDKPIEGTPPAMAADWSQVNAREYFDWHVDFGNNVMFCQAYLFGGTALYPSQLGPVAPGKGADLLPELYAMSRAARMPFVSYFCVGADLSTNAHRNQWIVPTSSKHAYHGFLAPESPWTDLLCDRIAEFLAEFPVEWLLFDWFVYGSLHPDDFHVQPAWFVKQPFQQIIGRPMPEKAEQITLEESLTYKRQVLARQFHAIQKTVRLASPGTKIMFNIPYWKPAEAIWTDHPMMIESDALFAESSREDVVEWLMRARKPDQRVMTTIIGHPDLGCDPHSWRKWHEKGLDFFGYAWATPPDFRPCPVDQFQVDSVRQAFHAID